MLTRVTKDQSSALYAYWRSVAKEVPYYYDVDEDTWRKSMFDDTDEEGNPLFRDLQTYVFMRDAVIAGFIQYGISSFIFTEGEKDFSKGYGIIRSFHVLPGEIEAGQALLLRAGDALGRAKAQGRHAFFHYFGMTCNARCGKLHQSMFFLEDSLHRAGFVTEHEKLQLTK